MFPAAAAAAPAAPAAATAAAAAFCVNAFAFHLAERQARHLQLRQRVHQAACGTDPH